MDLLSIQNEAGEWVTLPTPYSVVVIPQSLSSSEGTGRDVSGGLHVDRIAIKRTVSLAWNAVTPADFVMICTMTSPLTFRARVYDATTATVYEGEFYRGNDFAYSVVGPYDDDAGAWNAIDGTSMTLTEV